MKIDVISLMTPAKAKERRDQSLVIAKSKKLQKIKAALSEAINIGTNKKIEVNAEIETACKALFGDKFADVTSIISMAKPYEKICGVYFLLINDAVVYVGQSTDVHARMGAHSNAIPFDSYAYIECEKSNLDLMESAYIHLLSPALNGQHSSGQKNAPIGPGCIISLAGEP